MKLEESMPIPSKDTTCGGSSCSGVSNRWWGHSAAFKALDAELRRLAPLPFPVMLLGETGTGKEGAARRLHLYSKRPKHKFVAVNISASPSSLVEAEWFGVTRGAFTGADRNRQGVFSRAHGGTLFLDEIGELSLHLQPKLLRVLQEGIVQPLGSEQEIQASPRIITATHQHLEESVSRGSFRQDLFHRLHALVVRLPPLRERVEDIPLFAEKFARGLSDDSRLPLAGFSNQALEALSAFPWPGNLRQFEWTILRLMLRANGNPIQASDVSAVLDPTTSGEMAPQKSLNSTSTAPLEKTMILSALRESSGVISEAARRIGWTRQKLYRRLQHFGIDKRSHSADKLSSNSTFQ